MPFKFAHVSLLTHPLLICRFTMIAYCRILSLKSNCNNYIKYYSKIHDCCLWLLIFSPYRNKRKVRYQSRGANAPRDPLTHSLTHKYHWTSTVEGDGVLILWMAVQIELNSYPFVLVMDLGPNLLYLIFGHRMLLSGALNTNPLRSILCP